MPQDIGHKDHLNTLPALKGLNTFLCPLKGKRSAEVSALINKDVVVSSLLFYQAAAVTNHGITSSVQKNCCKTKFSGCSTFVLNVSSCVNYISVSTLVLVLVG